MIKIKKIQIEWFEFHVMWDQFQVCPTFINIEFKFVINQLPEK